MEINKHKYMDEVTKILKLSDINISLYATELLVEYLKLLYNQNKVINLVSVKSFEELIETHLYDSSMVARFFPEVLEGSSCVKVIDIGSGGGFPAIPMSIIAPSSQWMMVESIQKKATFLKMVSRALQLHNVIIIPFRAEEFIKSCPIPPLNLVTFRAVGKIEVLYPFIQIFQKRNIPVMLWKNPKEIIDFNQNLPKPIPFTDYSYPVKDGQKHILVIR